MQMRELTAVFGLFLGILGFLSYLSILLDLLFFPILPWPPDPIGVDEKVVIAQSLWWIQYKDHCLYFDMNPFVSELLLIFIAVPTGLGLGGFTRYISHGGKWRFIFLIGLFLGFIASIFLVYGIRADAIDVIDLNWTGRGNGIFKFPVLLPSLIFGPVLITAVFVQSLYIGRHGIDRMIDMEINSTRDAIIAIVIHIGMFLGLLIASVQVMFPLFFGFCS
ncbi:MAG: hypothetical protein ACFFFG_10535 [Candidatus Thorarchaeota archaeon]